MPVDVSMKGVVMAFVLDQSLVNCRRRWLALAVIMIGSVWASSWVKGEGLVGAVKRLLRRIIIALHFLNFEIGEGLQEVGDNGGCVEVGERKQDRRNKL